MILGLIALILYSLNLYIIKAPLSGLLITLLGLSVNIISLLLIHYKKVHLRKLIIKLSILPAIAIFLSVGINIAGILSSSGFLLATIAKLQENILQMKFWFLFSAVNWLIFDFYIDCNSCKLFDILGISFLAYTIYSLSFNKRTT